MRQLYFVLAIYSLLHPTVSGEYITHTDYVCHQEQDVLPVELFDLDDRQDHPPMIPLTPTKALPLPSWVHFNLNVFELAYALPLGSGLLGECLSSRFALLSALTLVLLTASAPGLRAFVLRTSFHTWRLFVADFIASVATVRIVHNAVRGLSDAGLSESLAVAAVGSVGAMLVDPRASWMAEFAKQAPRRTLAMVAWSVASILVGGRVVFDAQQLIGALALLAVGIGAVSNR